MNLERDPTWNLYPETVLELHLAGGPLHVDLREPVTPAVVARLARLGPSASFAVITSDNPHARGRDTAGNVAGGADLARTLRERGVVYIRADGTSPDGAHRGRATPSGSTSRTHGGWRGIMANPPSSGSTARRSGSTARWWRRPHDISR
ncbi:MAG: DUF3293 domain-containing protein [Gemmatimonadaceae bacterium]